MFENNRNHAYYVKQFGKLDNKKSVLLLLELVHKIFHEMEFELRFRIRLYQMFVTALYNRYHLRIF